MFPLKKILCTTDFSEPAATGVKAANELALNQSAELVLVSVVTPVYPIGAPGVPPNFSTAEYYEEMVEYTTQHLEKLEQELISPEVTSRRHVARGNAADEIVRRAEEENADLIVIATHGWSGWRRLLFGSVAEKVLRSATCPVLAIPEPRE